MAVLGIGGCTLAPSQPVLLARGPGTVWPTIDAAAVDALRFTHNLSPRSRVERGGAIRRAQDGFSYEVVVRGTGESVQVRLGREDVAWFHTHIQTVSSLVNRLNEEPSPGDREMVDRVDPRRRPLYILTPSGRVIVYRDGVVSGVQSGGVRVGGRTPMGVPATKSEPGT